MAGLLVGIILLSIWPRGRLEILQSPEMMMCAPITLAVILMHISTMIYTLIASPLQTTGRHFLHGVIAGLFLMASAIFAERSAAAKLRQSDLIGELCLATFLITPVVLGLLSRHDATK